ncbi:helix-turn-helix domain-containing protein [Fluviicola taffensis]|uniref:Helix-turn-helix domain protein n=1 Tax=Fluviicola taffensis (strain DSM 16823 / NCIMB 13979 / RW262) TaxID=755732 RepID=F2IBS7_FLUTR|nr:helix-turn-helix transcriptional regulator [Fluviicola taffensis]AEA45403.1 helix-turn-helix domain protein [Fluviicola taffensis DSM 16823]
MEIKDRLRMIMDSHKLNAGSFADRIGVQRSNVSHVLSGRNKPSFDFVEKLLQAFPRVSAEWLFTGRQSKSDSNDLFTAQDVVSLTQSLSKQSSVDSSLLAVVTEKRIVKTIIFYEDFTFDVFLPSEK